jgi:xanthine dehydrogenase accessory factor
MDVIAAAVAQVHAGQIVTLVTVLDVSGNTPSRVGARLAIVKGSVVAGTLGCSEFDTAGLRLAVELDAAPTATLRQRTVFGHGDTRELELLVEQFYPQPALAIVGSTPVGVALASLGRLLERRVIVISDGDFPVDRVTELSLTPSDAIVLTDHDAPYVDDVLRRALDTPAGFVGMLGSRRHAPVVLERLRATGVTEDRLARIASPCGLDIGSRTPPEIALSIAAEMVAVEHRRPGGSLRIVS